MSLFRFDFIYLLVVRFPFQVGNNFFSLSLVVIPNRPSRAEEAR